MKANTRKLAAMIACSVAAFMLVTTPASAGFLVPVALASAGIVLSATVVGAIPFVGTVAAIMVSKARVWK